MRIKLNIAISVFAIVTASMAANSNAAIHCTGVSTTPGKVWAGGSDGKDYASYAALEADFRANNISYTRTGVNTYSGQESDGDTGVVTCTDTGGSATSSSGASTSSGDSGSTAISQIASNELTSNIVRSDVFVTAIPKAQAKAIQEISDEKSSEEGSKLATAPKVTGADVFVNFWEFNDDFDGVTYGINPKFMIGEKHAFTLTLPLYAYRPDEGDGYTTFGADGLYKYYLTDLFSIGGHANYLNVFGQGDNEDTYSYAGGLFISYLWQWTDKIGLSCGLLYDVTKPEDISSYQTLAPGLNLGFTIAENWSANLFGIGYYKLDAEDTEDDFYTDLGAEVGFAKGLWSAKLGAKTTVDLDNYESVQIYLGSDWRF